MIKQEFLIPRWKVVAPYPFSKHTVGDIILEHPAIVFDVKFSEFPNIFKAVDWWRHRTMEELFSVKYVKVIKSIGYYRAEDIAPVVAYEIDGNNPTPGFKAFVLKIDHTHTPDTVEPADENDYRLFKTVSKL